MMRLMFRLPRYLVLELAGNGDLHTRLVNGGAMDVATGTYVLASLAYTLGFVHSQGFVCAWSSGGGGRAFLVLFRCVLCASLSPFSSLRFVLPATAT